MTTEDAQAGGLAGAIDYANSWRTTYYNAVGNRALLRNSAALTLLGIGGSAAGYGLASGSNSAVYAGLGASGASIFGGLSYFQSTPRDRTYLAGSQAIGCALLAVRPWMMSPADFQSVTSALAELHISITAVQNQLGTVQTSIEDVRTVDPHDPYLARADVVVSNARASLTAAQQTYNNGQTLRGNILGAGYALRVTVDNIVTAVADKITQTEPDLSTLSGIVSGLSQTATQLNLTAPSAKLKTTPPSPVVPQAVESQADKKLNADVHQLQQLLLELAAKMDAVAVQISAAGASSPVEDLKNCRVAEVGAAFTVTPSGDTFTIEGGGASLDLAVQAGNGVPQAALIGSSVSGVSLTKDVSSGIFVARVTASASTPGGEAQLLLSDATGLNRKIVTITVNKASSHGNASVSEVAPKRHRAHPTPSAAAPAPVAGAQTPYEKGLSPDRVKRIQKALKVPQTGKFDQATRIKIEQYYNDHKEIPTLAGGTRNITPELEKQLLPEKSVP